MMYRKFFIPLFLISCSYFSSIQATRRYIHVEGTLSCCIDDAATTTPSTPKPTEGRFEPLKSNSSDVTSTTAGGTSTTGGQTTTSASATTTSPQSGNNTVSANDGTQTRAKRHNMMKRAIKCEPMKNLTMQLWELDPLPMDKDDLINQVHVGEDGIFDIRGSEDEMGTVDFVLKAFHTCGLSKQSNGNKTCKKVSGMEFKLSGDDVNHEVTNLVWNLNQATSFDDVQC